MNIEIPNTLSRHVWSFMFERRTVRELGDQVRLSAQQKQSDDGEDDADDSLPGSCFVEKQNSRDGHNRGAAR